MYEKIIELINVGKETRNTEFKKTYDWSDPNQRAKIVRCILSMSNTKDGGHLILGVDDDEILLENKLCGMELEHFQKLNYDHIIVHVNKFADPPIAFQMHPVVENGLHFMVFEIPEFDEIPIVCKRSGEEGLKEGAVFSRSKSKPESAIIRSQSEMRELIDIAINKGIHSFYSRIKNSGLQIVDDTSSQSYDMELDRIEVHEIFGVIKKGGYWKINIRPTSYAENRINSLAKCEEYLRSSKVSFRGWDFPHISTLKSGQKFIQSSEYFGGHEEFFRFFKSGQFVFYKAMPEESMASSYQRRVNDKGLEIITTLFFLTEVFEFASRIFNFEEMGNQFTIDIELFDIQGRQLFFYDPLRVLYEKYISEIDNEIKISKEGRLEDLILEKAELALEVSKEIFGAFGLNTNTPAFDSYFKEEQENLLTRRL